MRPQREKERDVEEQEHTLSVPREGTLSAADGMGTAWPPGGQSRASDSYSNILGGGGPE